MIKPFSLLVFSLIVLMSCSSIHKTKKSFIKSKTIFKGGVYKDKSWSESLEFNRYSWLSDAKLEYEILLHRLDKKSPFFAWFGKEGRDIALCNDIFVGLSYTSLTSPQKRSYFYNQFEEQGYEDLAVLEFSKNIMAHTQFHDWGLQFHKTFALCAKGKKAVKKFQINAPGYKTKKIN